MLQFSLNMAKKAAKVSKAPANAQRNGRDEASQYLVDTVRRMAEDEGLMLREVKIDKKASKKQVPKTCVQRNGRDEASQYLVDTVQRMAEDEGVVFREVDEMFSIHDFLRVVLICKSRHESIDKWNTLRKKVAVKQRKFKMMPSTHGNIPFAAPLYLLDILLIIPSEYTLAAQLRNSCRHIISICDVIKAEYEDKIEQLEKQVKALKMSCGGRHAP